MRSEDVALMVGSGSLVMTRGEEPGVPSAAMWSQFSS